MVLIRLPTHGARIVRFEQGSALVPVCHPIDKPDLVVFAVFQFIAL